MEMPIVSWIDGIIKKCFESIFSQVNHGTDDFVKARDFLDKGQKLYSDFIKERFGPI
jgi:hypothetical protein